MLLEYDALCLNPELAISSIYRFINETSFDHQFTNVTYEQEAFDAALRTLGLHTVSGPVLPNERKTILPPEIFEKLSNTAFWRYDMPEDVARITHLKQE